MKAILIGLGMVAKTHVAALKDAKSVDLLGVLGRSDDKTKSFAEKAAKTLGAPVHAYKSIEQVASDPQIDFAIVATPPNARSEIVRYLVAARKPILMEKPIERTFEAAHAIVAKCAAQSVTLGVVFQHRARAASIALKEAISVGRLGDVLARYCVEQTRLARTRAARDRDDNRFGKEVLTATNRRRRFGGDLATRFRRQPIGDGNRQVEQIERFGEVRHRPPQLPLTLNSHRRRGPWLHDESTPAPRRRGDRGGLRRR